MSDPAQWGSGHIPPSIAGSDGSITIRCRVCGKKIIRQQYRGFSSAICAVCQGEIEKGVTPEEILANVKKQEEVNKLGLYNGIGPGNFKAHGFGQRTKEVIEKIRKAATRRRRGPLFSKKDEQK